MPDDRDALKQLDELLSATVEQSFEDDKLGELGSILESSAPARELFVDYLLLHNLLEFEHASGVELSGVEAMLAGNAQQQGDAQWQGNTQQLDDVRALPIGGVAERGPMASIPIPRRPWYTRHISGTAFITATLLLLALIVVLRLIPAPELVDGGRGGQNVGPADTVAIATLTGADSIKWSGGTTTQVGDRIPAGTLLAFTSGIAEISYDTGVRLVVEGPAEYVVGVIEGDDGGQNEVARNSGYLKQGELVAQVGEAKGFFVDVEGARVEDLGTEFGVTVRSDAAEVVVIEGSVACSRRTADGALSGMVALRVGEGARLSSRGEIAKHAVDAVRIVSLRDRISHNFPESASPFPTGQDEPPENAKVLLTETFTGNQERQSAGLLAIDPAFVVGQHEHDQWYTADTTRRWQLTGTDVLCDRVSNNARALFRSVSCSKQGRATLSFDLTLVNGAERPTELVVGIYPYRAESQQFGMRWKSPEKKSERKFTEAFEQDQDLPSAALLKILRSPNSEPLAKQNIKVSLPFELHSEFDHVAVRIIAWNEEGPSSGAARIDNLLLYVE